MKKIVMLILLLMITMLSGCSSRDKVIKKYFGDAEVLEKDTSEDKEVVKVSKHVISTSNGKNAGPLIHKIHKMYNDTICYGKIERSWASDTGLDLDELFEMSKYIHYYVDKLYTSNKNLQYDLDKIDLIAMRMLNCGGINVDDYRQMHRMFHDLDIYVNGYLWSGDFGVTRYKGE